MTTATEAPIGSRYGARLFLQHQALLEASAISPDVASRRGYVTVTEKTRLERLGFADYQRRTPGLLIPVWSTAGKVATYQYRPDEPRLSKGRPVKYETPSSTRIVIDCHRDIVERLADPTRPLIITEGIRKADAAITAGHDTIALLGVWNWLRHGTALPDWRDIALQGRPVHLAFDSDSATNPKVGRALDELAAWLEHRGATVTILQLPADQSGKTGLDDYLAAGGTIDTLPTNPPADPDSHLEQRWPDLDDFLASPDEPYRWVIPGLLEAGDRLIWTGPEGGGKSTLLRQIAVQTASGEHPFTGQLIDPSRVLLIDCENSIRQVRRKLRPLRDTAGSQYRPGMLHIRVIGHAIDLARPEIEHDLADVIDELQPDIIVIGPLYKLAEGDPKDEQAARLLAGALDRLRAISDSALIIEAHTPYADNSKSRRPLRPYGASLWSRWPEFGIHMDADGNLEPWRGHRDERDWPEALERATPWPWMPAAGHKADGGGWHGPTRCMDAVLSYLERSGEELSRNQLAERLRGQGNSYRNGVISEAVERLASEGRLLVRDGPRKARIFRFPTTETELL